MKLIVQLIEQLIVQFNCTWVIVHLIVQYNSTILIVQLIAQYLIIAWIQIIIAIIDCFRFLLVQLIGD